jgi:hypothetical protein
MDKSSSSFYCVYAHCICNVVNTLIVRVKGNPEHVDSVGVNILEPMLLVFDEVSLYLLGGELGSPLKGYE